MTRDIGSRMLLLAGFWVAVIWPGSLQADEPQTGVLLVGRSDKDPPLYRWWVMDPKTKKAVGTVDDRWGFTPVPPGEYELVVRKYEMEVPWGTVTVTKDKITKVEIKSGVELVGRSEKEKPLYRWHLLDPKTKKTVTQVDDRWGYTPVPPGDYELSVRKYEVDVPFGTVKVAKDEVTRVEVNSGVELVGRSDKEPPLYRWYVVDPKSKKTVTQVDDRWGYTPVPPGDYELSLRKYEDDVPYGSVKVVKGEITRVEVIAGVELFGRSDKDPPLYRWYLVDRKTQKSVTQANGRWGFAPVPPGDYELVVWPDGAEPYVWAAITVAPAKTKTIKMNSGIELSARSTGDKPFPSWYVYDANSKRDKKPLLVVKERWGFAALPPGEYGITDSPGAYPWAKVKVSAGEITKIGVPTAEERLANVTGAGRKTEKQRDPVGFKKLEVEIERSIRRGAAWLKTYSLLSADPLDLSEERTTIGVLALLHSGELERNSALGARCLDYLLRRKLDTGYATYSTAITTMALGDLDPYAHPDRIFECAKWLVENQGWGKELKVWGYGDKVPGIGGVKNAIRQPLVGLAAPEKGLEVIRQGLIKELRNPGYWDNSCSQFGVLGLHSAAHAGIKIPRQSWEQVEQHFRAHQNADGGWGYQEGSTTGSMTCAGLASLVLARHHLGQKSADPAVVRALESLAGSFTLDQNPHSNSNHYYYVYGLERAGVLAGTEFLGDHEWYPEGARYLLSKQKADGSWQAERGDGDYLDTCYAILFLRRATLPPVPPKPASLLVTYTKPILPPAIVPNVELVLDCSGSMNDKVSGEETRMQIARRVMDKLITDIPDHFSVGLRIFGHEGFWDWRTKGHAPEDHPGWRTDTELLIPMGALGEGERRGQLKKRISAIEAAGNTPLCFALLQARKDFPESLKGPKAVILVSDGLENCGGKMEDVEKAYKGSGIDVVIHVVGLAVTEQEDKVLATIAKMSKGNYYKAADANELAKALKDATGILHFEVRKDGATGVIAQGLLNGPGVVLKPGTYQVSIQGIREAPLQVKIESGQKLQLTLDDAGKLIAVGESKNSQGK
jgi:von Willebrand factor type A domain